MIETPWNWNKFPYVSIADAWNMAGFAVAGLPPETKKIIAEQVLEILKPHVDAGHMVQQTENGLMQYMSDGLTSVIFTPGEYEVYGFAKLYPYPSEDPTKPPKGYEFSTWVSKYPKCRIGDKILEDALEAFKDQANPHADFFAVCSSANMRPQIKLLAAGGVIMDRPSYVPNMLAAQSGSPHQETCINLKPLLFGKTL